MDTTTTAWDAIVIGSGIGGLTAASLLSKLGHKRVLVLEKHYERGGLTQIFRRDGASWDVGVHYVGGMEPGSQMRRIFDLVSGGELKWNPMPFEFDRLVYLGKDGIGNLGSNDNRQVFSVPSDPKVYQERLISRFPEEEEAIRGYFRDVQAAGNWFGMGMMQTLVPSAVAAVVGLLRRRRMSKFTQTTQEYLDGNFKSSELKALLTSQWADYGLPPAMSAFVLHALVIWSFAHGAWFPEGGSGRIARTLEVGIEGHGGAVKVCHEAAAIVLGEDGRVVGVKAMDRRSAEPRETVFHAPVVISDAGAAVTYNKLLPVDGETGRKTATLRKFVDGLGGGPSAVTLYLRLSKPASAIGVQGENYWIHIGTDHGDLESQTVSVLEGTPQHAFMSFPSAKAGAATGTAGDRVHTAEVLAITNCDAFTKWAGTEHNARGTEYLELKDRISQGLLDLAERATPGIKALVTYSELSTPLSIEHYTSHPSGAIYGLKGTPERYKSGLITSATPIPGLYLSGCDASDLGITGSMMGGVMAASRVLGPLGFFKIMRAASNPPPPPAAQAPTTSSFTPGPESGKRRAIIQSRRSLKKSVWELTLDLDEPVEFTPGQFAVLRVAPFEWRSYSIASASGHTIKFLISTSTGGCGSVYVQTVKVGSETQVELPLGQFHLQPGASHRIFVATGTGIAPFLPMFEALQATGELGGAELLFGCRLAEDNIVPMLEACHLPPTTLCVDGETARSAKGVFYGRVTERLAALEFDPDGTHFYLCGLPAMVSDCHALLLRAGAKHIITELY